MPYFHGVWLDLAPTVYPPSDDSALLLGSLGDVCGRRVLDLCTGSGVIAIGAAKAGARTVVAVDANPAAVACARANAQANSVAVDVRQGDLFGPVAAASERFDLVTMNPPYLPTDREERPGPEVRAWDGGPGGAVVVDRFLAALGAHLLPRGRGLLVLSTLTDYDLDARLAAGWTHTVVAERPFFFERISVHAVAPHD